MKVGILCGGFIGWAGGIDFIKMIVESLASLKQGDLEIHLLVPDHGPLLRVHRTIRNLKHIAKSALQGRVQTMPPSLGWTLISEALHADRDNLQVHRIDVGRRALSSTCRRLGIDVLIPASTSLGPDFPVPWIGYIYDFQHKYFPEYFTPGDCERRDMQFKSIAVEAKAVVVNARAVANDVSRFLGSASADIIPLPFAAAPLESWLLEQPGTNRKYEISDRYFMISNQMWLHKGHDIAFRAFRELSKHEPSVQLVCTGQTVDPRDPEHFGRLKQFAEDNNLLDRIKILGMIPKRDQIELLKNSIAVVQPTSFEGGPGGGSVYDAVALGVPTIVSDIPVNREIEQWVTRYFPLNDVGSLCKELTAMLRNQPPRKSPDVLRKLGNERRRACGEVLWTALHEQAGKIR